MKKVFSTILITAILLIAAAFAPPTGSSNAAMIKPFHFYAYYHWLPSYTIPDPEPMHVDLTYSSNAMQFIETVIYFSTMYPSEYASFSWIAYKGYGPLDLEIISYGIWHYGDPTIFPMEGVVPIDPNP